MNPECGTNSTLLLYDIAPAYTKGQGQIRFSRVLPQVQYSNTPIASHWLTKLLLHSRQWYTTRINIVIALSWDLRTYQHG